MTHHHETERSYRALVHLFFQGFAMRILSSWFRKGGGSSKGGNFVKGKPTAEGKTARDEFFEAKKNKAAAEKKLTPIQRRMQSGGA